MSFMRKLRLPNEGKALIAFIDALGEDWMGFGWDDTKRRATEYIYGNPEAVKEELTKGSSIESQVYSLLGSIAKQEALSGKYHVYRGVLNAIGTDYARIFKKCLDCMVGISEFTEQQTKNIKDGFREDLSAIG